MYLQFIIISPDTSTVYQAKILKSAEHDLKPGSLQYGRRDAWLTGRGGSVKEKRVARSLK